MTAIPQKSFALGELTPALYPRSDLQRYYTGLRKCRNFIVKKQGGVDNRPGTTYIAEVKDSTKTVRLIPFIFNSSQTYVLEFGDLYMRVIKDGVQVEVSGVTAWNSGTAYVVGDLASRLGVNYYCILAHTNQQPPNATYWYPLTGTIFEIPTPYVEADLPNLDYAQSADVVTIVHPTYAPRELARTADTGWTLTTITFGPTIAAPSAGLGSSGGTGAATHRYVVTTVSDATGEESLQSAVISPAAAATAANPLVINWTGVSGGREYNIYKGKISGGGVEIYGYVGTSAGSSFTDDDIDPDLLDNPPIDRNVFETTDNYPSCVAYYQQSLLFGNTNNEPENIWKSHIGLLKNFTFRSTLADDDSIVFSLRGRDVNQIRHLVDLRRLIALTSGGEWIVNGDSSGVIIPSAINAVQQTYNGSTVLRPLTVNETILYVQARGSIIRNFIFDQGIDGYNGNDLTIFSAHLFEGYTIDDWAFQKVPNSIAWCVRSDGTLLGLTYIKEHEMIAWHRHDFTGGTVENVCVVPEGENDSLYVVVKRTINGSTQRYIEKMNSRTVDDIRDCIFMDSALSYDGRNTSATTMTLTTGAGWTHLDTLTLTASASFFVAGDVGNQIFLYDDDPDSATYLDVVRFTIEGYTSGTVVTGRPHKTVPTAMRSTSTLVWSKAVDEISGLDHLEGENVAVIGDGFVIASPNNASYPVLTVTSGAITLPQPRAVIHVGLPFISDIETLDIDNSGNESLSDKGKLITEASMFVEKSRGIWVGPRPPSDDDVDPLEDLREAKLRNNESYDEPTSLKTDVVSVIIPGEWNSNGRVFVRQVDPLPLSILSIIPSGFVPRVG